MRTKAEWEAWVAANKAEWEAKTPEEQQAELDLVEELLMEIIKEENTCQNVSNKCADHFHQGRPVKYNGGYCRNHWAFNLDRFLQETNPRCKAWWWVNKRCTQTGIINKPHKRCHLLMDYCVIP